MWLARNMIVIMTTLLLFLLPCIFAIKPRTLASYEPLNEPNILSPLNNMRQGNETIWRVRFKGQGSPKLMIDLRLGFIMGSGRKPGDEEYSRPGLTIAGGLSTALSDLNKKKDFFGRHVEITFDLKVGETFGDEERSIKAVATFWKDWNVSLIIGPQETCVHEARLASSLNIPIISYVSFPFLFLERINNFHHFIFKGFYTKVGKCLYIVIPHQSLLIV